MQSIREIYKIGHGPSSSHTMGPKKAAEMFLAKNPDAASFGITLYGSLAATGKGHLTDKILIDTCFPKPVTFEWKPLVFLPIHPNALKFEAINQDGKVTSEWTAYSIGGGDIIDEHTNLNKASVYKLRHLSDILEWTFKNGATFWEYVNEHGLYHQFPRRRYLYRTNGL